MSVTVAFQHGTEVQVTSHIRVTTPTVREVHKSLSRSDLRNRAFDNLVCLAGNVQHGLPIDSWVSVGGHRLDIVVCKL